MSNPVYLSKIKLSQFRSFGTLDLTLPTVPSVLLVQGSNGLGKSSLFDGLEWALTDSIDHFRKAKGVSKVGHYLCRWRDTPLERTFVGLTFSDGSTLERSLASKEAVKSSLSGSIEDVTAYLRNSEWTQSISKLSHYLLLTHFLGQSSLSRMTNRDDAERFDIFKEAAQSRQLESIATALHGKGNTLALRAFTRLIQTYDREITALDELLAREATLWIGANDSGAIDDANAHIIREQVLDLLGISKSDLGLTTVGSLPGDSKMTKALEGALAAKQESLRDMKEGLNRARLLVEEWSLLKTRLTGIHGAIKDVDARRASDEEEIRKAQVLHVDAFRKYEDALTHAMALKSRRDSLIALRMQRELLEVLRLKSIDAVGRLSSADTHLAEATLQLARIERREKIIARLEDEAGTLTIRIAGLHESLELAERWLDERARKALAKDDLARFLAAHPNLPAERPVSLEEMSAASEAVQAQALLVENLRESVDVISRAVASIASNLVEDTHACPVCATYFTDPESLRSLASTAAGRLAPLLLEQESRLQSLTRRAASLDSTLQAFLALENELHALQERYDMESRRYDAFLATHDDFVHDAESPIARMESLHRTVEEVTIQRDRKRRWIDGLSDGKRQHVPMEVSRAKRLRNDRQAERDSLSQDVNRIAVDLQSATADVASLSSQTRVGDLLDADGIAALVDEAVRVSAAAELDEQAARQSVDAALEQLNQLSASRSSSDALRKELDGRLTISQAESSRIKTSWGALELETQEPDESVLGALAERSIVRERKIQDAEDLLGSLARGRIAWANQIAHREALESLRLAVDGAPNDGREQLRNAAHGKLERQRRAANAARTSKGIAQVASEELMTELEEFNAAYIKPLDGLMKQINQAILTDPRVGIDFQVHQKKIEQCALKDGEVPTWANGIDPALVHSEGQMAALAVGMLCAGSLTFPWSRWPALVLDDPLQHNDSIHASAFADLIGNLVTKKSYQVFISTHDVGQGEFLQRKFESRNIPCAVLNLLGNGRDGVETSFRSADCHLPSPNTSR